MNNYRRSGCSQNTMNSGMMGREYADSRNSRPARQYNNRMNNMNTRSLMEEKCSYQKEKTRENTRKKTILEDMPLAMGYVPSQQSIETFDTCKALSVGTIFPVLCKPFCGRAGGRR